MNYYISDMHLGHPNIIRYDNRPFLDVEKMDETLINNWNAVIGASDTVYNLGDFSWHKDEARTIELLDRLNGHKVLIRGNHDRLTKGILSRYDTARDYMEIKDEGERVILCHYPIPFWNGQFKDSIHLYGHVHNSHQWNVCESLRHELEQLQDLPMRMYNVGCMMPYMKYIPRRLDEILRYYENEDKEEYQ